MGKPITICALFYGDHPRLAHRCLDSLWSRIADGEELLQDIRLAMNVVSQSTREVVTWFAENVAKNHDIQVVTYDCQENAHKYPMMRRMLLGDRLLPAKYVMWFDDDSYLDYVVGCGDPWWSEICQQMSNNGMLGKVYRIRLQGYQWNWIQKQPWFNPDVGMPPTWNQHRHMMTFCTGGWWTIHRDILCKHDWPPLELRHCGGDSTLGELFRHAGYKMLDFHPGVRINADDRGRHSKAARRGTDEKPVGFLTTPVEVKHDFVCERKVW